MYYIEKENKIVLFDEDKAKIENTLIFMPDLQGAEILETDKEIVSFEGEFYFADDEEYIEKSNKAEAERIAKLSLTKREVFLAIYQDKLITPEQIRAQITDPAALIEFDYAEKYYRGNPLIDLLGASLGYTTKQLDYLFENKTFENTTPEEGSGTNSGDGDPYSENENTDTEGVVEDEVAQNDPNVTHNEDNLDMTESEV